MNPNPNYHTIPTGTLSGHLVSPAPTVEQQRERERAERHEAEVEDLAERIYLAWNARPWNKCSTVECFGAAEEFLRERDRRRAAR